MVLLKIIGSICICLGCVMVGIERKETYKHRIWILKEMEHSLIMFKNFTQTYRLPLENVCEKICAQTGRPVSEFYQKLGNEFKTQGERNSEMIWEKTIKQMNKAFDKDDQMLFLKLGYFIGIQDLRLQNEILDDCITQVKQKVEVLEKERPEKEKLYRVLSFTVSGFLILLFI